jgi:hypothetical protein
VPAKRLAGSTNTERSDATDAPFGRFHHSLSATVVTRLSTRRSVAPMPFAGWQTAFDPLLGAGARNYWKSHDFKSLEDDFLKVVLDAAGRLPTPTFRRCFPSYTRRPNTGVNNPGLVSRDTIDSLTLAKTLVARGANPNQQATKNPDVTNVGRKRLTEEGATPFWVAAQTLDLPYMRRLLELGADPLLANSTGDTPLLAASGLVIEKPGESPGTPEEVAAAVRLLLDRGADATTVDEDGNTALHGAAVWGSNDAVTMLVAAGAKLDVRNTRGLTPWRIAEGAVFEDAVLAQPQTAALLRRLMEERGLKVE